MSRLRVLVVGAGTMGTVHSHAYSRLADAELVGVVDPFNFNPRLATALNVPQYRDMDDVTPSKYDVLDVCVPSRWHRPYVLRAAQLKKSVFCEKPLAIDLHDAQAMIDAVQTHQIRMSVGHCVRFFPEYVHAKSLVENGALGDIAVVRTFRGGGFPSAWNDWYASRDLSGGTLVDLMIHDFDYLRWVLGPVSRVYAKTIRGEMNRLDFSLASVRFASGAIAHMEGTWAHQQFGTRFEFAGSRGILTHDSYQEQALNINRSSESGVAIPQSLDVDSPYDLEIAHFIEALHKDLPFRVTPDDAYQALRVALAAQASALTGKSISLAEDPSSQGGEIR